MGIPALFGFLSKHYSDIIIKDKPIIDNIYFDLNCLIHPQCHKIIKENPNWNNINHLEDLMIKQIKEYLTELITYINPQKLIYISIDGNAPLAKIKQQRDRRFKSAKDKAFIQGLKQKLDIPVTSNWDTNCITPGTVFMNKLKQELILYINDELKYNGKIIFDSADIAGEGEHKILDYVKQNKDKDEIECIYGLDADLIILSIISFTKNIYLLRESTNEKHNNAQSFLIVSIQVLTHNLLNTITDNIIDFEKYNRKNLLTDFVFYCFLLGNDFIPKIPSLNIRDGSIQRLITIYSSIINELNNYLIIDNEINVDFFIKLLENLAYIEEDTLKTYTYFNNSKVYKYDGNDIFEEQLFNYENLLPKQNNILNLGELDYKYRYYKTYYNICYENEKDHIQNICLSYINSLQWTFHYYVNGCIDWRWCYPYYVAPFISDLLTISKSNIYKINDLSVFNKNNKPFSSVEQLLLVLPKTSNHLLPPKYQYLQQKESPIMYLYPDSFNEFTENIKYRWQSIPQLPYLNYNIVSKIISEEYIPDDLIVIN